MCGELIGRGQENLQWDLFPFFFFFPFILILKFGYSLSYADIVVFLILFCFWEEMLEDGHLGRHHCFLKQYV